MTEHRSLLTLTDVSLSYEWNKYDNGMHVI